MLNVVSNTTPILSLLKINSLHLLKELYQTIWIPLAVYREIESGKHKDYYQDLAKLDWIQIREISTTNAITTFPDLDEGEAEAILLAKEIPADLLILDEKKGRFHAKQAHLSITGTLGVLIKAKSKGYIRVLSPVLSQLKTQGIWISDELTQEVLKRVGE